MCCWHFVACRVLVVCCWFVFVDRRFVFVLVCLFLCVFVCVFVCLFVCLFLRLRVCLCVCLLLLVLLVLLLCRVVSWLVARCASFVGCCSLVVGLPLVVLMCGVLLGCLVFGCFGNGCWLLVNGCRLVHVARSLLLVVYCCFFLVGG